MRDFSGNFWFMRCLNEPVGTLQKLTHYCEHLDKRRHHFYAYVIAKLYVNGVKAAVPNVRRWIIHKADKYSLATSSDVG